MRLCEISIALSAGGGATLAFWFRLVAFHVSYPDVVRQRVLASEFLLIVHVLASDASGPDFWSADTSASGRWCRSAGALGFEWR